MSAEVLREAARLMRERAEAATPGRWAVYREAPEAGWVDTYVVEHTFETPIGQCPDCGVRASIPAPDAEHIASWGPIAALTVADWLEQASREADEVESLGLTYGGPTGRLAIAVARAYLGAEVPA